MTVSAVHRCRPGVCPPGYDWTHQAMQPMHAPASPSGYRAFKGHPLTPTWSGRLRPTVELAAIEAWMHHVGDLRNILHAVLMEIETSRELDGRRWNDIRERIEAIPSPRWTSPTKVVAEGS